MNRRISKSVLMSIGICLGFAIVGGLLTGDALENWFAQINQPWFSLPLWGWYIVGGLYYIMTGIILYRLIESTAIPITSTLAFWLTIGMMAGNEFWNYLFFGLESPFLGFVSLIPFTVLVLALFIVLWKVQRFTAWVLLPYLLWLGYDLLWAYNLWKLNE